MGIIDLHVHSTASDGSFTPSDLVDYAIKQNISAFALTDHDTISGVAEAIQYSRDVNKHAHTKLVTVIPGIELSAEYFGQDIHILGLNIDYTNQQFLERIESFRKTRTERNKKMIQLLQENGFNFTEDMIHKRFGDAVITRAHYAIMMIEGGYVKDKDTAFKKYLNPGCICYVPRTKVTVKEAIQIILAATGKPVLAHPVLYKFTYEELDQFVQELKQYGLQGIEAIYSLNQPHDQEHYEELAKKYNLFITGGSDFHGIAKPNLELGTGYGNLRISDDLLKNII